MTTLPFFGNGKRSFYRNRVILGMERQTVPIGSELENRRSGLREKKERVDYGNSSMSLNIFRNMSGIPKRNGIPLLLRKKKGPSVIRNVQLSLTTVFIFILEHSP